MKIVCFTVGKKHSREFGDAIALYEKRLKPFCDFSWHLIGPTSVDSESAAIARQLKNDDYIILLDENGIQPSNNELADKLEELQNKSTRRLVLIIGGAYGVNHQLMSRADLVYSISSLVFPHQLMRLILVEQLYRSYSILGGTGYHHE
jgi:23S rRNA (pseudouridine1915-N3)-methyltransferase